MMKLLLIFYIKEKSILLNLKPFFKKPTESIFLEKGSSKSDYSEQFNTA